MPKLVFFPDGKMFWERHILTRPQTEELIPTGVLLENILSAESQGDLEQGQVSRHNSEEGCLY